MAEWNDADWVWISDIASGGVYQNKNNGSYFYNGAIHLEPPASSSPNRTFTGTPSDGRPYGAYLTDDAGNPVGDPIGDPRAPSTRITINPADSTGAWSIQFDSSGQGFKVNKITGEVVPLGFDKTPGGQDPSGYDPKTELPYGVIRDSKSPSGYLSRGKPVNADGSLYSGSSNETPDFTMIGGRPYIWDGSKLVPAPGAPPGSTGTTGTGGSFTPSRPSSSSSGGGGSSSSGADPFALISARSNAEQSEIGARLAADKELAQLRNQLEWEMFQAKMAYQDNPNSIENQVRLRQLQQADERLKMEEIQQFRSAVSDVDPAAFRAFQFANGLSAGGNIANRLSEGGNALSDNANAGAAALLSRIRGPHQSTFQQMAGLPSTPGAGVPSTPAGAPGVAPTGSSPVTPGAPLQGLPPPSQIQSAAQQGYAQQAQQLQQDQAAYDNAWTQSGNGWVNTYNMQNGIRTGIDNLLAPEYLSNEAMAAQRASLADTDFYDTAMDNFTSNVGGLGASQEYYWKPVSDLIGTSQTNRDALGQLSGVSYQTISDQLPGFAGYSPQVIPYGDDNIQRELQQGETVSGQPQPVFAARGLHRPYPGTAIVGDPQRRGVPNPEKVTWTPRGNIVEPLGGMNGRAMRGLRGMPRFAEGTFDDWAVQRMGGRSMADLGITVGDSTYNSMMSQYQQTQQPAMSTTAPAPETAPVVNPNPYAGMPADTSSVAPEAPTSAPSQTFDQWAMQQVPGANGDLASFGITPGSSTYNALAQQYRQYLSAAPATGTTPLPATGTTPSTGTAGTPQTQVPTASGDLITTDPQSAAQIEEIRQWRESQLDPMFADIGPYSLQLAGMGPSFQQGYLQNYQTARGIPAADFADEIRRFRLKGLSREAMLAGSGR